MHGFWTLVKAEFTVEVISKILFSGKFPRPVALLLVFLFFVWFIITRLFRICKYLFHVIFIGKKGRIRGELRAIVAHTKKFDDRVTGPIENGGYMILSISNPTFRRNIVQLTIRINLRTEQLDFTINRGQGEETLPYETIVFFSHSSVQLHRIDGLTIYQYLRINLL
jgi:hypothetical protein